jgi:hypothetical protein
MKRILVIVVAGTTLAAAVAAPAAPTRTTAWTKCGPRFTFLVWPHGHPAIPKVKFPQIRNPHIEAYLDFGNQWPDARAGAWVLGGKPPGWINAGDVFGPCLNYGDSAVKPGAPIARAITVETQTAVECTFARPGVIDIVDKPKGVEIMLVHAGNELLAEADATPTGASLRVPAADCRRVRPPS